MLEIDGSFGEGGGQIIRSALALSILRGIEIKLINIRANRSNPGLAAQHITAIKAAAKLSGAKFTDLKVGNQTLEFYPGKLKADKFKFDIGTAGSISLVLQTCILPALFHDVDTVFEFDITGGTNVKWSPQIDYLNLVFLKHLATLGANIRSNIMRRGYYPKGGGEVILKMRSGTKLRPFDIFERGEFKGISGIIHSRQLPSHVAKRISESVKEQLLGYSPVQISFDEGFDSFSPGTGIVLVADFDKTILAGSALGARGIPAEQVGAEAVNNLINELNGIGTVDTFAADQLIPYLGILGGRFSVARVSNHTTTNLWLVERLLNKKFQINVNENHTILTI